MNNGVNFYMPSWNYFRDPTTLTTTGIDTICLVQKHYNRRNFGTYTNYERHSLHRYVCSDYPYGAVSKALRPSWPVPQKISIHS